VTILALLTVSLPITVQPALAVSPDVVISQVYGGGGNSGATYTHDYIELFNRGTATVSLAGWSVQYASATGTGNFGSTTTQITPLSGTLAPGQYLLIQEASTAAVGAPLPAPDITDATPIAMAGGAGKVALVSDALGLGCNGGSTPCSAAQLALIVDLVGYGNANFFEGAGAAPALTNSTAAFRADSGCVDTDHNNADFAAATTAPRNTASPPHLCATGDAAPTVAGTFPADGATNFPHDASLQVSFSEPVDAAGAWYTLQCSTSGSVSATASGGPTDFTLDPDTNLVNGETCTLTILAAQVTDQDTDDPPDNLELDFTVGFTAFEVCAASYTPIYAIQGSGLSAAITGLVTTQGVVVGDFEGSGGLQGFYLQDAAGDGDTATSDGLFVLTGGAETVSAGDLVRVSGFARERFNQTTLNGANNNSAAVPATNIVTCGESTVAPVDVTLPVADLSDLERYEGMLVRFPQALVISEYFNYARFGEMVLALPLDGETRAFTPTAIDAPGAPALARAAANNLRRITLDDGLGVQNPGVVRHPNGGAFALDNRFRGGDTVQNAVGVLGFDFSLYRLQPTGPADYAAANPRTAAPEPAGGSLQVAAMNTLNFFLTLDAAGGPLDNTCGPAQNFECRGADADQPSEFTRQRDKLLAALAGLDADIIGLNELENTLGVDPLGDPINGLVAGLNAMPGADPYAYIDTGVIGTDAIRVGLIYRPSQVTPVGGFQVLDTTDDARFLDTKNRPALAQTFEAVVTGNRFTVVINHLKSKGSDCNDVGDPDAGDGQGNCNGTRALAAQALVDWLATDPTGSGDPDFLILGDLNSYAREDPIAAILAGPDDTMGTADDYTNLIAQYQGSYAYSYVFDGQAGYLDHALASPSLAAQVSGAADWHINADEPNLLDYDTTFKPPAQQAIYAADAYRASDHDPVVVGLCLPPALSVSVSPMVLWPANHKYVTIEAAWLASSDTTAVTLISATSNEPDNGEGDGNTVNDILIVDNDTLRLRAERSGSGAGRVYTITYQATNACGAVTTASATVTVPLQP
jgi:predicted extracellular nuclease